jgi:serine/threonine protein kinase
MEQKCPQCGAPLPSGVLAGLCPTCLFKQGAAADTAVPPDVTPFLPPSVEEVARMFPQLEIIALLGKGGMGAVYQARQPALDRIVALKILPPQTAGGPSFVERFNREARALAKLNHPNIVAVYEFGQVNGLPFFLMEFVDGLNLRQLERAGKLSAREALQIVPQICDALQFAHDEGVVHRDIKPENILLDKKGRVKIADFGIAKILGNTAEVDLTGTQSAIGTPHYMAPEQMEKPTTVDHRADIFSLGVVFYEMLTGELPLGKFAPPSSRKIEVDVRLDDVVLRALEKDPERRYQHVSQVKTAVDTIASTAPPPPPPSGEALTQEILARDYSLDTGSCLRRGWALVRGDFWPIVGISALITLLWAFANSSGAIFSANDGKTTAGGSLIGLLASGPLFGGLYWFFLKRIRGETTTVETAFSGFSNRFLHLFLAYFVSFVLTVLGLFCLILPGIYLMVAWTFTLPLIMDKGLDFWSAMELSRKIVTKHWWKFFGFVIFLVLLKLAGLMVCLVGVFITVPIAQAALMYAYEDIFGGVAPAATVPPLAAGPSGTIVMPVPPPKPQRAKSETWTPATKIGLAAVVMLIGMVVVTSLFLSAKRHRQNPWQVHLPFGSAEAMKQEQLEAQQGALTEQTRFPPSGMAVVPIISRFVFGELELTNLAAIKLASGQVSPLPSTVTEQSRGPQKDSAACAWLAQADMDFAYVGGYDGFYGMTRDLITLKRDDWDNASPESVAESLHDTGQDVEVKFGDTSRLNHPTNFTYGFKTRDGRPGLLQVIGFTENPSGVKIRYKLAPAPATNAAAMTFAKASRARDELNERLEAASNITDPGEKDAPLAALANDAAKLGEADIVRNSLSQMIDLTRRDEATHEAVMLLAKRGLRKSAIDLAKGISESTLRDRTLVELAQQHSSGNPP